MWEKTQLYPRRARKTQLGLEKRQFVWDLSRPRLARLRVLGFLGQELLNQVPRCVRGSVGLDQKNLRTAQLVERDVEGGHRRWNEWVPARRRRDREATREAAGIGGVCGEGPGERDRKSTRLNSSHTQ